MHSKQQMMEGPLDGVRCEARGSCARKKNISQGSLATKTPHFRKYMNTKLENWSQGSRGRVKKSEERRYLFLDAIKSVAKGGYHFGFRG